MVNRRDFIRSALAGLALTIAAPVLARFNPCKHLAFESVPGIDGVRCLDCGRKIANGSIWNAYPLDFLDEMKAKGYEWHVNEHAGGHITSEYRETPRVRGSMIRFRRDPSRVFEL